MKQSKLRQFLDKADIFTKKNSPAVLAGLAIGGVFLTAYTAWKASPKAEEILERHREDMKTVKKSDKDAKRAVIKETVKEMAPVITPVVLMAGATSAAIVGSQKINARRIAALSAAYTLSKDMVSDMNDQMLKEFGPKKVRAVKDAVFEKKIDEEHPDGVPVRNEMMINKGLYWCRDYYTQKLFMTNADQINRAINAVSSRIRSEMYIQLREFWEELRQCGALEIEKLMRSPVGQEFGWSIDDLDGHGTIPIKYSAALDDGDAPILVLDYRVDYSYK